VAYALTRVRSRFGELVSRARFGHERVVITEHGAPVAAIISMDELADLQQARDALDLDLCRRIKARSGPGLPDEEFMALLEAEDARQG
jgi:prevent-host-death family protein